MLDQFTPQQKQLALAGVPAVAVFALVASRKKAKTPAPTGSTTPIALGGGGVGVDQLAAFENAVTGVLTQLQQSISDLENQPNGPSQVPPANQPPAPTPTQPAQQQRTPTGSLSSVYGVIPTGANYGYGDFPTTNVATSVKAPTGGTFLYGQWNGDTLVSATYQLPDGSFVSR